MKFSNKSQENSRKISREIKKNFVNFKIICKNFCSDLPISELSIIIDKGGKLLILLDKNY